MKLINVSRNNEGYIVKALLSYRLLGLQLFSRVKVYELKESHNAWYEASSKKKVSKRKRLKLNKWLKDHQKFIEKI
ncbi:hypothetical protein C8P64_1524 [Christiangramia gaetbulicola]|uniref:Uncharacterized protein n=1 Tax=Christiangramia gaetbulicola TaxID=703340 RepID=A0A2T6AGP3_9FLAO|nr:hypothetical protein [Christiangramia gaetbulicola]PTX43000.1 hypothetical protein C8P64_1524 [Christiangramia gaetbulicola]